MNRKRGFTLIELLVVIAIIALLLAIVMPSLGLAKRKAKMVVCRSNLKQWGTIFVMYTQDNDDRFYRAWTSTSRGHEWINCVQPYYQDPQIAFCPSAKKIRGTLPSHSPIISFEPNEAWGRFEDDDPRPGYAGLAGSYAINDWVGNPAEGFYAGTESMYWVKSSQRGASRAPLFLDSRWLGGWPMDTDTAPTNPNGSGGVGHMGRYCIDRHEGYVNAVFVDFSVDKIGLKQLWKQKWHPEFDTSGYRLAWPEWMEGLKD